MFCQPIFMISKTLLCILSRLLSKLHCYENKGTGFEAYLNKFLVHKNSTVFPEQSFAVCTDDLNPDSRLVSSPQTCKDIPSFTLLSVFKSSSASVYQLTVWPTERPTL